jgi:prophage regulatory protein
MSGRRFLRLAQVKERVGLSTATIYRLIAAKKFPASVPLGLNSVGWPESEIDDWSEDRIAERDRRLAA